MLDYEFTLPESIEKDEPNTEENKSTQKNNRKTGSLNNSTTEKTKDNHKIKECQNQINKYFSKETNYFIEFKSLNENVFIIKIKDINSAEENIFLLNINNFLIYINSTIIKGKINRNIYIKYISPKKLTPQIFYILEAILSIFKITNAKNINTIILKYFNKKIFHFLKTNLYFNFDKWFGNIFFNAIESASDINEINNKFYYNLIKFTFLVKNDKMYKLPLLIDSSKKKNVKLIKDKDNKSFSGENNSISMFDEYENNLENQHIKEISFLKDYIDFCKFKMKKNN